jgi:hypothetical protein
MWQPFFSFVVVLGRSRRPRSEVLRAERLIGLVMLWGAAAAKEEEAATTNICVKMASRMQGNHEKLQETTMLIKMGGSAAATTAASSLFPPLPPKLHMSSFVSKQLYRDIGAASSPHPIRGEGFSCEEEDKVMGQ